MSMPLFDLMAIYYFTIYRKGVFQLWFVCLLGVWSDALNNIPLGITALSYIIAIKLFLTLDQKIIARIDFKKILQPHKLEEEGWRKGWKKSRSQGEHTSIARVVRLTRFATWGPITRSLLQTSRPSSTRV